MGLQFDHKRVLRANADRNRHSRAKRRKWPLDYNQAAEHHTHAAKHRNEAAKHHESGNHEKAAHQAPVAVPIPSDRDATMSNDNFKEQISTTIGDEYVVALCATIICL
jgi:hypothetical protein